MFLLIFSNRSMYMSLLTGKNTPDFAKDTVYRFMKMVQINWMRWMYYTKCLHLCKNSITQTFHGRK